MYLSVLGLSAALLLTSFFFSLQNIAGETILCNVSSVCNYSGQRFSFLLTKVMPNCSLCNETTFSCHIKATSAINCLANLERLCAA